MMIMNSDRKDSLAILLSVLYSTSSYSSDLLTVTFKTVAMFNNDVVCKVHHKHLWELT